VTGQGVRALAEIQRRQIYSGTELTGGRAIGVMPCAHALRIDPIGIGHTITRLGLVGIRIPCNLRPPQLTCTCTWQAAVFMVSGFVVFLGLSQIAIEIEIVQIGNRNKRGWEEGVLFIA